MITKKKTVFLGSALFILLAGILFFPSESYAQEATSSITITSPNGGEKLIVGSTYTIAWDFTSSFNNVAISFFRAGGGSVLKTTEVSSFDIGIVSNTGNYSWRVPTGLVSASDYKIRIIKMDDADFGVRDESDATLTIKEGMVITSPVPGAVWEMSSSQTITWTSDVPDHEITIGLIAADGRSTLPIGFRTFSSSAQSFTWVVQSYVKEGDYFVRLMNSDRTIVEAITPHTVKVIPGDASIRIITPKQGDAIEKGSPFTIQWDTTGDISTISIELFNIPDLTALIQTGRTYILTRPQNIPNTGQFIWNVSPTLPTDGEYLIRVFDAQNVYLGDSIELNVANTAGTLSLPSIAVSRASLLAVTQTKTYKGWFSGRFTLVDPSVKVTEIVAPTPTAPTAPPTLGENSLIILPGDDRVFVIKNNKKEHIANLGIFNQRGYKWENVQKVDRRTFDSFPVLTLTLIRTKNDGRVYQIINGRKRHIPSVQAFSNLGLNWSDISEVARSQIDTYPRLYLARAEGSSKVYYISGGGYKKWIRNIEIFNSYDNKWDDVAVVSQTDLDIYPDVNLIKAKGGERVYKLEGSTKRWVKTAEIFNKLGYDWGTILTVNETEFDFYSEGSVIES